MKKQPLLSIHVSVFNLEKYIVQCLDSIVNQNFDDYELILIDNGSTDKSIEICELYAERYPQVKYVKMSLPTVIGRPLAYALNTYKGQYFMTVDGDDYLTKNALTNIISIIKQHEPDLIMGTYSCDIEEGQSNFKDAEFDKYKINNVPYFSALKYIMSLPNFHTFQWRFILKRGVLSKEKTNYKVKKDTIYSRYNDGITVTGYLLAAHSIVFMPEPFYVYRRRASSLSAEVGNVLHAVEFFKAFLAIADKFQSILERPFCKKKQIVYRILEARFELFRILLVGADKSEFSVLENVISKKIKLMRLLIPVSKQYKDFYRLILSNKNNYNKAIELFLRHQNKILNNSLESCEGKSGYIFPTGLCGFQTFEILKARNISVISFIDNDPLKHGKLYSDIPCKLVESIKNDKDITEHFVYIATGYKDNISKMKAQVMEYGILEKNIYVR
jgi:glycosyltransferase involved in cell wall biosynthesis